MSQFQNNSIFWIDIDKIKPNPYQPRREFDETRLNDLAESIRQYGVLQPLVVTRHEITKEDGGLATEYELLAGERRLRASKIAGLSQVPVTIRSGEETDRMKLEIAIIENLQREDLNPVDRARAFERLVTEFGFSHSQIGRKVGKSREYVSNTLRLLMLPDEIKNALIAGKITEGHTRPLLMLGDRPEEQTTLFKEIVYKQITVREAESIARKIAYDKARKPIEVSPEVAELEQKLSESLGTRVQIEQRGEAGGKVVIDFFSKEDLRHILDLIKSNQRRDPNELLNHYLQEAEGNGEEGRVDSEIPVTEMASGIPMANPEAVFGEAAGNKEEYQTIGRRFEEEKDKGVGSKQETPYAVTEASAPTENESGEEEDLYSIKNFTI
jgi:ParB family chromosome partitioning protein